MAIEIKIMKNEIKIYDKNGVYIQTLKLNFEPQTGTLNRPFILSGTRKNIQLPEKWIDKVLKNHWFYSFKYLDEVGGFFEIEIDYENKYVANSLRKS